MNFDFIENAGRGFENIFREFGHARAEQHVACADPVFDVDRRRAGRQGPQGNGEANKLGGEVIGICAVKIFHCNHAPMFRQRDIRFILRGEQRHSIGGGEEREAVSAHGVEHASGFGHGARGESR